MDDILEDIRAERSRQDEKWGTQRHTPEMWMTILAEEVGEAAKDALDVTWMGNDREYYLSEMETALHKWRDELIQCAAVAVATIEHIDKKLTRK